MTKCQKQQAGVLLKGRSNQQNVHLITRNPRLLRIHHGNESNISAACAQRDALFVLSVVHVSVAVFTPFFVELIPSLDEAADEAGPCVLHLQRLSRDHNTTKARKRPWQAQ